MEQQNEIGEEESNEIVRSRNSKGFYSVVNRNTGAKVNVYQTREEILKNLEIKNLYNLNNKNSTGNLNSNSLKLEPF